MGGFSFLVMLGLFAGVLYWYISSFVSDTDGKDGLFGIQEADDALLKLETDKTSSPSTKRSKIQQKDMGKNAADIRARVESLQSSKQDAE